MGFVLFCFVFLRAPHILGFRAVPFLILERKWGTTSQNKSSSQHLRDFWNHHILPQAGTCLQHPPTRLSFTSDWTSEGKRFHTSWGSWGNTTMRWFRIPPPTQFLNLPSRMTLSKDTPYQTWETQTMTPQVTSGVSKFTSGAPPATALDPWPLLTPSYTKCSSEAAVSAPCGGLSELKAAPHPLSQTCM